LGAFILDFIPIRALSILWTLGLLLPGIAVGVRRLHDTGRSAWWLLTGLIPIWLLVLFCLPGKMINNRYSENRYPEANSTVTEANVTSNSSTCSVCGKLRLPGQAYCVGCGTKFVDS
jgi:hypothetical protein